MNFDWKSVVKTVAPALGTALLGPMGGAATKFIADKFLGNADASEKDIANSIMSASPEQLAKLKELDNQFEIRMAELGVDIFKIEVDDRKSARDRQISMRDWTPNVIAFIFIIGYFFLQWHMLSGDVSENEQIMSARMQDALMLIFSFFYGSSLGSRIKDMISKDK